MAITQAERLSYTRRDAESFHDDVSRYLKAFIPRITETSEANEGRLYLTAFEALIDNANYSVDKAHNEAKLTTAQERKNILTHAYASGYTPKNVSAASVDATVFMLSGVAPGGGQAIPIYTEFQTATSPALSFINVDPVTIPEGEASTTIPLVQGLRTSGYSLTGSASGDPDQTYTLPVPNTPTEYLEVQVNGIVWDLPTSNDLYDAGPQDEQYYLTLDEDNYITVHFGDGQAGDDTTFGKIPPAGASITVSFIQCNLGDGNVPAGDIAVVIGSLATTVGITNSVASAGGSDAEDKDAIVDSIAANHRAFERAVTLEDYEHFSKTVSGVYDAYAEHLDGTLANLYILPDGGGVASSTILTAVETEIDSRKLEGALVDIYALREAPILIQANMVLNTSKIQKSTAKNKALSAIIAALDYTQIKPGRGFKLSDITAIFENLDSGTLVDYVDIRQCSRVPTVVKSNASAPDFVGRVLIYDDPGYSTILVQALSATAFLVSVDGTPESVQGSVGVQYTLSSGKVKFTLGTTSDTLTVGDTWTMKTSKYRDNIYLDPDEYMGQDLDSDIAITVYYPGEYDFVTGTAS